MLPELGALPDVVAVLAVLLDYGQDAAGDDAVGFAEVAVDLLEGQGDLLLESFQLLGESQASRIGWTRHGQCCCIVQILSGVLFLVLNACSSALLEDALVACLLACLERGVTAGFPLEQSMPDA